MHVTGTHMDITTRLATPEDAPTLHAITQAAFDTLRGKIDPPSSAHRETVGTVSADLTTGSGAIAELAGIPVGAVRFRVEPDGLYVGRVAVDPAHRGRGVARALMAAAEREAAARGLPETQVHVRRTLTGNVAMFERLGYRVASEYVHPRDPSAAVLTLVKPVASADHRDPDG